MIFTSPIWRTHSCDHLLRSLSTRRSDANTGTSFTEFIVKVTDLAVGCEEPGPVQIKSIGRSTSQALAMRWRQSCFRAWYIQHNVILRESGSSDSANSENPVICRNAWEEGEEQYLSHWVAGRFWCLISRRGPVDRAHRIHAQPGATKRATIARSLRFQDGGGIMLLGWDGKQVLISPENAGQARRFPQKKVPEGSLHEHRMRLNHPLNPQCWGLTAGTSAMDFIPFHPPSTIACMPIDYVRAMSFEVIFQEERQLSLLYTVSF